jgi:hypothetical protein
LHENGAGWQETKASFWVFDQSYTKLNLRLNLRPGR